MVHVNQVA